jgi:hypothetical protein
LSEFFGPERRQGSNLGDIGASNEGLFSGPGQDENTDGLVLFDTVKGLGKFFEKDSIEGIEGFGAIEGQSCNAVGASKFKG